MHELRRWSVTLLVAAGVGLTGMAVRAADQAPAQATPPAAAAPPDFTLGIGDQLLVSVWRDQDASANVVVRPDGRISLPLIGELQVLGMTPAALGEQVTRLLAENEYIENPVVQVTVTQINSLKVFIMGEVNQAGEYPLLSPTNIVQLIAMAGGLKDYADKENIIVIRAPETPGGAPVSIRVNYEDILDRKNLDRNIIWLKPGDTVIVK